MSALAGISVRCSLRVAHVPVCDQLLRCGQHRHLIDPVIIVDWLNGIVPHVGLVFREEFGRGLLPSSERRFRITWGRLGRPFRLGPDATLGRLPYPRREKTPWRYRYRYRPKPNEVSTSYM